MSDCRPLAELIASWGGSVVPARVVFDGGSWTKSSIRGWPQKASRVPGRWPENWFHWGGAWHVALCPRHGGLVAMDLDGEHAIDIARQAVRDGVIPWDPPPLAYRTPGHGGGMHVIWRWPASLPAFSRLTAALPGGGEVDMRGESGFLLLVGAPRPDVPGGRYEMVSRPGDEGPPPAPDGIMDWVRSLGPSTAVDAPIHQGRQLDPDELPALAASQGGRLTHDRHTTLFRLASYPVSYTHLTLPTTSRV